MKSINNKGFSLVELMIVVAIIGILAAVAVPNFKRFQAKAKQTEAKTLLANYYTVAQAAHAEFGVFPGNFVATGFKPDGNLNYDIVAADGGAALPPGAPTEAACINTTTATCTAAIAGYKSWNASGLANASGVAAACAAHTFLTTAGADIGGGTTTSATGTQAVPIVAAGSLDQWQINQDKLMFNDAVGIPN